MTTENEQSAPRRRRAPRAKPTTDSTTAVIEAEAETPEIPRAVFSSPSSNPNAAGATDGEAATTPKPTRTRAPRRSSVVSAAATADVAEQASAPVASEQESEAADAAESPAPRRGRGRHPSAAASDVAADALLESEPMFVAEPATAAAEESWEGIGAAPASPSDLARIQRALTGGTGVESESFWDPDDDQAVALDPTLAITDEEDDEAVGLDEETIEGEDAANAPRRRRRRGRRGRGRGGAGDANGEATIGEAPISAAPSSVPAPAFAPQASVVPRVQPTPSAWTPILPSYAVEFEPTPPPTKRRPSRRPGSNAQPRFSAEEQREVDAFVAQERPALRPEPVDAAPLTEDEQRELEAERARPRRRRRGSGASKSAVAETDALQLTPDFAPIGAAPAVSRGGNALEALLARQNVILDTLMERQIALLRNIERALVQLDRRMSGAGGATGSTPRTGVFVDVPNVMYAAERLGWTIDFGKLLLMLTRGRELVRASAYAPISDDPQLRLETQRFAQPFMGRGYRIVTKPLKRFADGTMKGNFDVEMAMDILTMADRLDVVCLISGDGDFSRLVEMVEARGVRVEVAAFAASTSGDLRAVCDDFIDLTHKQREIAV